jgi:hydroxymethylpyrimidine/phosphomethylpyrimidine kinase
MVFSALTIAGSDSGGGAGVQADLKTFAAHRVHGLSILTSLTAQNTLAVKGVFDVPGEFIEEQFKAVHEDFLVGAAKTGMLSTRDIIKRVARNLGSYPLVVDPVMVSESGGRLLAEDAISTLKKELLPKATLTTPNLYEAEILADMRIKDLEAIKEACKKICRSGSSVVIKGGHLNATDTLFTNGRFYSFPGEILKGGFHGSGCTFAASITANLALGFNIIESVANAKEFIKDSLESAYEPGRGEVKVVNQMGIGLEESFDNVSLSLRKAVTELEGLEGLFRLVPEVGMNICYAKDNAHSLDDVAGVSGRIHRVGDKIRALGGFEYGASRHVARIVLSAMSTDKKARAAANIKYRPNIIEKLKNKNVFFISSFDRDEEPDRTSTMEWGTRMAINKIGEVPDLIYDKGGVGKEPMIRVLGRDPSEVVLKLRKILGVLDGS